MDMDITTALSGHAGLPGVQWLLNEEPTRAALRATLAAMLEPGVAIGTLKLDRAKYKPGRYMQTYYAVELTDAAGAHTRLIEVNWLPPGKPDPRGAADGIPAMQAEIIERGLAAPFRTLAAENAAWGMWVQAFPLDAEYPQLARLADPAYVHGLLADAPAVRSTAASYRITPIRYRPGQRHVLRYDPLDAQGTIDATRTLFAKTYNSEKGARTFKTATTVSEWLAQQQIGIGAARPLAYLPADNLVLYPRVSGTPLSDLLREPGPATDAHLRAAGAAIRALHATPESLVELQPHSFAKEVKSILSAAEYVHPLLPDTGAAIKELVARAQALHERLPAVTPAFAYGDFKADHLWITPAGMTLIDFDTCYLSDPMIDLGKFLADIRFWYAGYGQAGAAEAQQAFLAGYGALTPEQQVRARLYEGLVLTKSTVRRVKLFDPAWGARVGALIAQAVDAIAQAEAAV
jgi:hypothetical protein